MQFMFSIYESYLVSVMLYGLGSYRASFIFFFIFLAVLRGTQDLSSLIRGQTRAPCSGSVEP